MGFHYFFLKPVSSGKSHHGKNSKTSIHVSGVSLSMAYTGGIIWWMLTLARKKCDKTISGLSVINESSLHALSKGAQRQSFTLIKLQIIIFKSFYAVNVVIFKGGCHNIINL